MEVLRTRRVPPAFYAASLASGPYPLNYGVGFKDRKSSFYRYAVNPTRIELDKRIVKDLLDIGEDAVASVSRLCNLLASDPSIHGSKKAEVPV